MVRFAILSLVFCAVAIRPVAATSASVRTDSLESLPRFDIPSFDYRTLQDGNSPKRVLQVLEADGILALRNVPNFANLRKRYLTSAVNCALVSERDSNKPSGDASARYLSTKFFADGTKRLTLEATAGRDLDASSSATDAAIAAACPDYHALHREFSRVLEHAVTTFGDALDQSDFVVSDGDTTTTARRLVADAVRLDHFHVYEPSTASRTLRSSSNDAERHLSLPLHEDHGLFIAMAAPMFFRTSTSGTAVTPRRLESDASGLVIRLRDGRDVRPVLHDDDVVIMIGTGATRWLATSHTLPAVLHGMHMPPELVAGLTDQPGARHLRVWFGKMTLLPTYQRVLASRQSFGEFTNRTTRFLLDKATNARDLKTIGCATGRRLHDSGGACGFRKCTLKNDPSIVPPTVGCAHACNYGTAFFDAKCAKKCDCEEQPKDGVICWMLCTARFATDECPVENQVCEGLKNTCTLPTTAPAPTTEAPKPIETPAPTAVAPVPTPTTTPTTTITTVPTPLPSPPVATSTPVPSTTPSSSLPTTPLTPEPTMPTRGQC